MRPPVARTAKAEVRAFGGAIVPSTSTMSQMLLTGVATSVRTLTIYYFGDDSFGRTVVTIPITGSHGRAVRH